MSHYLFIESQDPFEDGGTEAYLGTALELSRQNQPVTVFLVENGANAARNGARVPTRDDLQAAGAAIKVDEFALRERGIRTDRLAGNVETGTVEDIVALLSDPETKAVWH